VHFAQPVPRAAAEVEPYADGDVAERQRTHERHFAAQIARTQHHAVARCEGERTGHRLRRQLKRLKARAENGVAEVFDPLDRDQTPAGHRRRRGLHRRRGRHWRKLHRYSAHHDVADSRRIV
jgi:hypothetical protein